MSLIVVSDRYDYTTVVNSYADFAGGINAYGVEVRFKSGDFMTTTATTQVSTAT
jgi:hypothetical protein